MRGGGGRAAGGGDVRGDPGGRGALPAEPRGVPLLRQVSQGGRRGRRPDLRPEDPVGPGLAGGAGVLGGPSPGDFSR